jgi:hypothetical protein
MFSVCPPERCQNRVFVLFAPQIWRLLKGYQASSGTLLSQEEYVVFFTCCFRAMMPTENPAVPDVLVRFPGLHSCSLRRHVSVSRCPRQREWYTEVPEAVVMSYSQFTASLVDFLGVHLLCGQLPRSVVVFSVASVQIAGRYHLHHHIHPSCTRRRWRV